MTRTFATAAAVAALGFGVTACDVADDAMVDDPAMEDPALDDAGDDL